MGASCRLAQAPGAQPGRGGAGPPSVLSPSGFGAELHEAGRPPYLHDQDAHPHRAEHVFIVIKPHLHLLVAALGSEDHSFRRWRDPLCASAPPPGPGPLAFEHLPQGFRLQDPAAQPQTPFPPTSDAPRCGPRSPTAHLPSGFRPVHPRPSHIISHLLGGPGHRPQAVHRTDPWGGVGCSLTVLHTGALLLRPQPWEFSMQQRSGTVFSPSTGYNAKQDVFDGGCLR